MSDDSWSPPDWLGRACHTRPSLIRWRKRPCPALGRSLDLRRSEAMEAPPTPSAKNTWAMMTSRVRDGGVVVVDVVVVVVDEEKPSLKKENSSRTHVIPIRQKEGF